MADSLEFAFTCQVCFEEFEKTGNHVPRLLPCTHTLCETCIGQMIQGDMLECPECRQKHRATRKEKSFPQNKYILVNIKRRPVLKEENQVSPKQPDFDLCEKHNRLKSLYCVEDLCQKLICHLCLKNEHRNHDFDDAQQILEEKRKNVIEHVDSLTENLLVDKEKLLMAKKDAKKDAAAFTEKITRAKDEQIATVVRMMTYLFNTMMEEFMDSFADISTKVDSKTSETDDNLHLLADIKEKSKMATSVEDIVAMKTSVNMLVSTITSADVEKLKTLRYHESQPFTWSELHKFTGFLESIDMRIDVEPLQEFVETTPLKTIQSAFELQLQVKNTFHINLWNVFDLCVMTGGKVATFECQRSKLEVYNLNDGQVMWSRIGNGKAIGMTEVSVVGKQCLAISFTFQKRIEFRNMKNLDRVVFVHSVSPHMPGHLCTIPPSTLLYEDVESEPRIIYKLDCSGFPQRIFDPTPFVHTGLDGIWKMNFTEHEGKQFVFITNGYDRLLAYNGCTDELEWTLEGHTSYGIASDERGHLFNCVLCNGKLCVDMYTVRGEHLGTLESEEGVFPEPCRIRWCRENSSLILVNTGEFGQLFVSVVAVKYPE